MLDGRNSEIFGNGKAWIEFCLEKDCIANIERVILSTSGKPNRVTGPVEKEELRKEVQYIEASGGIESPETIYEIFKNALDAVPNPSSNSKYSERCRIYAFLDQSVLTEKTAEKIISISNNKDCVLNPVKVPSRRKRSEEPTLTGLELLLWLSKATGGSVITVEKPSTPKEMLDALEKEFGMEACKSKNVSGPLPDGYACKQDCLKAGMCWDKKARTCFCKETHCSKKPLLRSRCPKVQCKKMKGNSYVIAHPYFCNKYYICRQRKAKLHNCYKKLFSGQMDKPCIEGRKAPPCKDKL